MFSVGWDWEENVKGIKQITLSDHRVIMMNFSNLKKDNTSLG